MSDDDDMVGAFGIGFFIGCCFAAFIYAVLPKLSIDDVRKCVTYPEWCAIERPNLAEAVQEVKK